MRTIRDWGIICLLISFSLPIFSQGTTTYNFLRDDVGARAAALGGSFTTATDDANAIFYNPAGLATLSGRRISIGFFKHLMDINAGSVSFGTEIQNLGFIGAGVSYINYGEFDRRGEEGQDLGTFSAGDFAFTAGYGDKIREGLLYGVNAKFIYSSIDTLHSTGVALDLGLQYSAIPSRLLVAASLLNLGTQISPYENTRERLPLDLRVGASVYPEHLPAVLMIDFHKLNEYYDSFFTHFKYFSIGAEFTASENVQFRFGYNNGERQDLKVTSGAGLVGLSAGIGITTGVYSIDYGFTSLGSIGGLHRISVGFGY